MVGVFQLHVPRNHGIVGHAKIILDLMKISVANSTADYLDVNIFWASVSAIKKKIKKKSLILEKPK